MNSVNVWGIIAAFIISAGIWFLFTSAIDIIEDTIEDIIVNKKKEKEECNDVTSTSSKMDEL